MENTHKIKNLNCEKFTVGTDMPSLKGVLIVDDNQVNRQILRKILSNDYNVLEAENGEIALSILRENSEIISVVLLDIVMPVMDGYEVLRQMHKDAVLSRIPVIVASGQNSEDSEVKALSLGANDYILKPYKPAIIKHRIANTIYLRETSSFVNSVQRDELTGVYSKEYFYLCVKETLKNNTDKKYDILCCDIERFKMVNDLYGTQVGDELLKYVADTFSEYIAGKGICGRMGADAFAFLIQHQEAYDPAYFKKAIEKVNQFYINLNIILRYGVYPIEDNTTALEVMYDRACLAKQTIKGKYGEYFACYDDTIRQKLLDEQVIVSGMKQALENGQFKTYFQPKYDLKTEKIVGAEALIRWNHPEKGFLSPDEFIPLFEKNGFITDLDIYIWDQCCKKIRAWIDKGNHAIPLSINVSRADIYNPDLVNILLSMIKKYKLSPKYLHLEITETAYTENPEQLIDVVTKLKKLGFIIEMDDFGTGYSSLNMLSELPIDVLKLDMKFIQGNKHSNNRNILSFIISLAKWLNLTVIAEGVETQEQVRLLQSLDCECAQGYYYAKPLPQDEFESLLLRSDFHEKDKNYVEQLLLSDQKTEKFKMKTILILDSESSDYQVFSDYYKDLYNVIQVYKTSESADFIIKLKENIALLVINGMDVKTIDEIEIMVNACKPYNIPTILLHDALNDLVNQAAQFGITDYLLKPYYTESFHLRVENVINRAKILEFEKEKESNAVILEMKKRAEQDSLTGLLNRAEFEDRINKFYYQNQNPDGIFIILDIDNFKKVNDTLGHMTGDKVLCAAAESLNYLFSETNMISRMGGDEFAVFIPYKIEMYDLCSRMEKLCRALEFEITGMSISCSAGVCISPENGLDYEQLYHNSDMALLTAKRHGKSQYRIFDCKMDIPVNDQMEVNAALLLDDTSDAMFVCDAVTSEIIYINDTACQIVGKIKQKCIGAKCYQIFWERCCNCDRCFYIDKHNTDFYEEDTYLKDNKTAIHIKAKLGDWDGRTVKIHYLQNRQEELTQ